MDGLDSVTPEDAATVVALLDELLRFTYEVPERLDRLRSSAGALAQWAGHAGQPPADVGEQ